MDPRAEAIALHAVAINHILDEWGFAPSSPNRVAKHTEVLFWLENFVPSEIADAVQLLTKLQYKSEHVVRRSIDALARELPSILGEGIRATRFFQLGLSPSDSGGLYLYDYRKALGLDDGQFPQRSFSDFEASASAMVFFDDIIGTGSQATRFFLDHLGHLRIPLYYVALFGFENGVRRVRSEAGFADVLVGMQLSDEERAFTPETRVFADPVERERIRTLASKYGQVLFPRHPLGYDDSQALLVFPHTVPNNTLPVIWAGPENEKEPGVIWNPVWRRRKPRSAPDTKGTGIRRYRRLGSAIGSQRRLFTLPPTHRRNPYFTPKGSVSRALSCLGAGDNLVLSGPPGVGKTQHAVQHAHDERDRYAMIFWASAESVHTLTNALLALARLACSSNDLESTGPLTLADFSAWLSAQPGWLLILDNADVQEVAAWIERFVPATHQGNVIVTSQLAQWTNGFRHVPVEAWTEAQSIEFFRLREPRSAPNPVEVGKLAGELGGLPLALEHAAAYIAETGITVDAYRNLLRHHRRHLFSRRHIGMTNYEASITATWEVSFRRLSWLAQHIVSYSAGLGSEPIPRSILEHLFASASLDWTYSRFERRKLRHTLESPDALNVALADLARYSLASVSEHTFQLHPSLQDVVLDTSRLSPWQARYWFCRLWGISGAKRSAGAGMWLYRTAHLLNKEGVLPADLGSNVAVFAMRPFIGHLQELSRKTEAIAPNVETSAWTQGAMIGGIMPLKHLLKWYQERIQWYSAGSSLIRDILQDNMERWPHLREETTWFLEHFEGLYHDVAKRHDFGGIPATMLRWLATGFTTDVRKETYHFLEVLAREHAKEGSVESAARLFRLYRNHALNDPQAPPQEATRALLHEALSMRWYLTLDERRSMLEKVLDWHDQHDQEVAVDSLSFYRGLYQYARMSNSSEAKERAVTWLQRVLPKARTYLAAGCNHACGLTEEYIRLVEDDENSNQTLRACEETLAIAVRSQKLDRVDAALLWQFRGDLLRTRGRWLHAARSYARCLSLEMRDGQATPGRQIELGSTIGAMYLQASALRAAKKYLLSTQELLTIHTDEDSSNVELRGAVDGALERLDIKLI